MKPNGTREIVVEYEQIKLIRKRASTEVAYCPDCGDMADFLQLADATGLFESDGERIIRFCNGNDCHYVTREDGEIGLCLPSLLASIRSQAKSTEIRLIGD